MYNMQSNLYRNFNLYKNYVIYNENFEKENKNLAHLKLNKYKLVKLRMIV